MHFDKNLWKLSFTDPKYLCWPCPKCWDTSLYFNRTLRIKNAPIDDFVHHINDEGNYLFNGYLFCKCSHFLVVTGITSITTHHYASENGYEEYLTKNYYPKYFFPNLRLFRFEKHFPKKITLLLDRSFSLYFADIHSAAVMLRAAIEKFLDLKKIEQKIALHSRIEQLPDDKLKASLMAIKWIGNDGAHINESKHMRKDYLDAVRIFHHILKTKFLDDKEEKEVNILSSKINKRKKTK